MAAAIAGTIAAVRNLFKASPDNSLPSRGRKLNTTVEKTQAAISREIISAGGRTVESKALLQKFVRSGPDYSFKLACVAADENDKPALLKYLSLAFRRHGSCCLRVDTNTTADELEFALASRTEGVGANGRRAPEISGANAARACNNPHKNRKIKKRIVASVYACFKLIVLRRPENLG
jgi:hypothetical protein